MRRNSFWLMVSLLIVLSLGLIACGAAPQQAAPAEEKAAPAEEEAAPAEATAPAEEGTAEAAEATEPTELTFWMVKSFVEPSNEAIVNRVKEFEKEFNVKVNVTISPYEDFRPLWSAGIESGNVPDVSHMGYQEVGAFQNQGVLMDVSDLLAEIQAENGEMTSSLIDVVTFEGKQWAIPYFPQATVLFYRKDLFEQAGLSGPPETWDQFVEYAKKLTDPAAGVYGAGLGLGRANSDGDFWIRQVLWSQGGALFNEDGTAAAITSPEGQKAFEFMNNIFTSGITPPGAVGWDDSGNNKAYLSGQAAMIINVGSVYYALNNEPENAELLKKTGYALVPAGPAGRYVNGISNNLAIFKDAKNPELAKKLVAYLLDHDFQREWMKVNGYQLIPVYPDLAEDEYWNSEAGQVFTDTPNYFHYLGANGPFTGAAGEVFNARLATDTLEQIVVQGKPVDEALTQLSDNINKVIEDYK